jgi:cytochrome bd ubiquinol oxidase subunit II
MGTLWFCLAALVLTVYVVLDGFDLGAGIIHYWVARTDAERRLVIRTVGPVWDGNELWLVAGAGLLFLAFPDLYASAFSGFYLGLMMVLWLLALRGFSIELRNHLDHPVWRPFWDAGFTVSGSLLALLFPVLLGNVVRGAPLDESRRFFLPLWTDFGVGGELGLFDWYTIPVAVLGFLALAQHGALWLALKTEGEVQRRARRVARLSVPLVAAATVAVTGLTFMVQTQVLANLRAHPLGALPAALAAGGLVTVWRALRGARPNDAVAFGGSCAYLAGMLSSAAFGVFPYVLPSRPNPGRGLTIGNAAAPEYGLATALLWLIPGLILALSYVLIVYRHAAGTVHLEDEGY